jgi:hypothetical protein
MAPIRYIMEREDLADVQRVSKRCGETITGFELQKPSQGYRVIDKYVLQVAKQCKTHR